jgi:hypothetical protein
MEATPLCLHAQRLTFTHPTTKERVTFEDELPSWAASEATLGMLLELGQNGAR